MSAKTAERSGGGRKSVKKRRIVFLDYLRAFMPLAVIVIHVCSGVKGYSDIVPNFETNDYFILGALARICRLAVPIFCMISGAIFLDPKRPFDYKKHYLKTIPRILLIFIFWSLIYATVAAIATPGGSEKGLMEFIINSLSGFWHLWYLKMLLAVYLLIPILRMITEDKRTLKLAVILTIFCSSMTTLGWILNTLVAAYPSSEMLASWETLFKGSILNMTGFMFLAHASYFIMGYFLATARFTKRQRGLLYGLGAIGLIATIVFILARSRMLGKDLMIEGDPTGDIGMLFYASALFVWVREVVRKRKSPGRIVSFMSEHSLGVYVIHALPILLACKFFEMPKYHMWSMFIIVPGSTIIVYGFSLFVSWIFSKIPVLKKVV